MGFLPFPAAQLSAASPSAWACREAARSPGWQLPLPKIQINNYPPGLHAAVTCPSQGLPGLAAATIPAVLPKCTGGGQGSPWLPYFPLVLAVLGLSWASAWVWLCWAAPLLVCASLCNGTGSWSLGAPSLCSAGSGPQQEGRRGAGSQDRFSPKLFLPSSSTAKEVGQHPERRACAEMGAGLSAGLSCWASPAFFEEFTWRLCLDISACV